MPLPIRDGNQSLTTLSTLIVNSAHVPAHTVVSLGSQAITDIAQAVSGVELGPNTINALENISVTFGVGTSITIGNVVSVTGGLTNTELRASSVTIGGSVQVSNFPATQATTFGSITGSVSVVNFPATQSVTFGQAVVSASNINNLNSSVATEGVLDGALNFVKIGGHQDGSNQTAHIVHVSAGGAMKVDGSGSTQPVSISSVTVGNFPATQTVTFTQASVTFNSITGSVSVLNLPATQTVTFGNISGSVTASINGTPSVTFSQASVTFSAITGSASILNFPATQTIAGTVTANGLALGQEIGNVFPLGIGQVGGGGVRAVADFEGYYVPVAVREGTVTVSNSVTIGSLPAISGTVTANVPDSSLSTALDYYASNFNEPLPCRVFNLDGPVYSANPLAISGTVTANLGQGLIDETGDVGSLAPRLVVGVYDADGTQLGTNRPFSISGTVTANNPSGALTTRFGSVTTANTAQITTAVTNTSRKYLLAQNISAGTVTIGIGFSPTTTQGIQLTAGAGLTFDAFCPTGAVYWLGAVTGAVFTILEG